MVCCASCAQDIIPGEIAFLPCSCHPFHQECYSRHILTSDTTAKWFSCAALTDFESGKDSQCYLLQLKWFRNAVHSHAKDDTKYPLALISSLRRLQHHILRELLQTRYGTRVKLSPVMTLPKVLDLVAKVLCKNENCFDVILRFLDAFLGHYERARSFDLCFAAYSLARKNPAINSETEMESLISSIMNANALWGTRVQLFSDILVPMFVTANDHVSFVLYILAKAHDTCDAIFFALVHSIRTKKTDFIELTLFYSFYIRSDSYVMTLFYCSIVFQEATYSNELATVRACFRFCTYDGCSPEEAVAELFQRLSLQSLKSKLQLRARGNANWKYL